MRIRENINLLHEGEQEVRRLSLDAIEQNSDIHMHVQMIERVMDMLQFVRIEYDDTANELVTVKLLGARLFNDMAASLQLCLSGYYQAAATHIRDILETSFLLDYFSTDHPALIERWKTSSDKERANEFKPVKVRMALDDRDGFTEQKRAAHYQLLCNAAAHPTFQGFGLLRPTPESDAHMGSFFVPGLLEATVQELVKVAVLASGCFRQFFKPSTITQFRATISHLETTAAWRDQVFGRTPNPNEFATLKGLLSELEAGD